MRNKHVGVCGAVMAMALISTTAMAGPRFSELPAPPQITNPSKVTLKFKGPGYAYYPERAKDSMAEGWAQIECVILDKGRLDCKLLSEAPEKYGFGSATLKLYRSATVDFTQSDAKVGDKFVHVYKWTIS
ncbi:hypothetical protein PQU92_09615 [Asticcacaulis sp. BYS171W]|uniref:TonB C-terminal domain-containing protein n=1 Tax=Asticcacaulis aquaticus TaxID=2984212 RepID=A0ABT5HTY6_9CAUL|nr:hypothetical protein [Asticcacaulis aquaticus]MDC7683533.1 hypothetical protein [Asticcacaulis aquaticus]